MTQRYIVKRYLNYTIKVGKVHANICADMDNFCYFLVSVKIDLFKRETWGMITVTLLQREVRE